MGIDQLPMSRRDFVRGIAGTAVMSALPTQSATRYGQKSSITAAQMRAGGAAARISVVQVRNNVRALMGSGGNILVLPGADGKISVDTGFATSRTQITEALAAISPGPLRHVIDTHWHFDHTDGNEWMHDAGATIIAQEKVPWALSVMAGDGKAILPLPSRAPLSAERLLPNGVLALWSYRDLADPRWRIGTKYIQLHQASKFACTFTQQMTGIFNPFGWGAYFRRGHLFVKKTDVEKDAKYPDFGCNFEIYTDEHSLELETLGPVRHLKPGQAAEHIEHWWLFKDVHTGEDESWIDGIILPKVEAAK